MSTNLSSPAERHQTVASRLRAVAALPKITQTKVIEDVEWRCAPLLGREAA